jgi:hypothetical protein
MAYHTARRRLPRWFGDRPPLRQSPTVTLKRIAASPRGQMKNAMRSATINRDTRRVLPLARKEMNHDRFTEPEHKA